MAALALNEFEGFDTAAQTKRNLRTAIGRIAARLGNTPTICRKCYVHPEVHAESQADAGYCSEANLEALENRNIDAYVACSRRAWPAIS